MSDESITALETKVSIKHRKRVKTRRRTSYGVPPRKFIPVTVNKNHRRSSVRRASKRGREQGMTRVQEEKKEEREEKRGPGR